MGAAALLAGCVLALGCAESRPVTAEYGSRLSLMPIGFVNRSGLMGSGDVSASLRGDTLEIRGSFEGVGSPVTRAALHRAAPGLRGPEVGVLEVRGLIGQPSVMRPVSPGTPRPDTLWSGAFEGRIALDPSMRMALDSAALYVTLVAEAHPDGVLRGWLFPADGPR